VFDESIPAESSEALDKMVKAAVGFVPDRDEYQSLRIALASVSRDEEGNPLPVELPEPIEEPNQYVELLLTHGVEVLAGLAFVLILLKTLRGAGSSGGSQSQKAREVAEAEAAVALAERELAAVDPALLARLQVEELVRSEPERVSEILAQWAADELASAGAGR
jgi:flagellar biosynthesis/type III secretory pathway M-ring protein FliF/YscJ